jgi:hypothetical protein
MSPKKKKTIKKDGLPEIIDGTTFREYQEPELFKKKFQASETCRLFRQAWHIPAAGFDEYSSYAPFHEELRKKDRVYTESDEFIKRRAILLKARRKWADGKMTDGDLEFATYEFGRRLPSVKYDEDVDSIVRKSNKPSYWRNFIEECLLFREVRPTFITRPPLELKARWSNDLQQYEIVIGNIFYDTAAKDFTATDFTRKLKELQKKLSGHGRKPRQKKSFGYGLKILELEGSGLTNLQKADRIEGVDSEDAFFGKSPKDDAKRKSRLKTRKRRMKSY